MINFLDITSDFIIVVLLALSIVTLFLVLFTWVIHRKVQLLNRTLQTPIDKLLSAISKLFFIASIVTLFCVVCSWINILL